jgi:UDP-2,3-diacylglucosamine hydrolase
LHSKNFNFAFQQLSPLLANKKLFFAADFHLGTPHYLATQEREKKIVDWLASIQPIAQALFLLGDIFDCWFEYKQVIPKGFSRLQGKLASFTDQGIPVYFFVGNHEIGVYDYLAHELKLHICRQLMSFTIGTTNFLVGHGDDLGGSWPYRLVKRYIYTNPVCQWLFDKLHPSIGMPLAAWISEKSRKKLQQERPPLVNDRILNCCKQQIEPYMHHDFYIFGHLHAPYHAALSPTSQYYNVGDWVKNYTYGVYDGAGFAIKAFV